MSSFQPLTLSVELWNDRHHVPQRRLTTEVLAQAQRADTAEQEAVSLRENEKIALERLSQELTGGNAGTWDEVFHAAASLRQRLEEAEAISQGRLRVLNEKADALRSCEIALMNEQAKREQAEAAIEEMQKRIEGVLGSLQHELKTPDDIWAAHIQEQVHQLETVLAELQPRRSPTGQEQG